MYQLGHLLTVLAFITAVYGLVAHVLALRTGEARLLGSGRGAVVALFIIVLLATSLLVYAFLTDDFSLQYVVENSRAGMPTVYKVAALWGGQEGSLLLWALLISAYLLVATLYPTREGQDLIPVVSTILLAVTAFFVLLIAFVSDPFAPMQVTVADGRGLNPLLQNPGMVIHPLTLYIGYVGFAVPFAFAMAALIKKHAGDVWIRMSRPWTMFAWVFLSIGIIYGGQWAYVELGWGGMWAWDPVENASLLPWLTATAYFHSVMIQEKRGMLKKWNMILLTVTFVFTILGTFITRSGVLSSVHSFSESAVGPYFLFFMGLIIAGFLYLLIDRANLLREDNEFESFFSKESSFLLNNLLLVGAAFAVAWGTLYPLVTELFVGNQITVGPAFFNKVNIPLGIALMVLMGICPLIAWRMSSWRNFRRNFLFSLAAAVIAAVALVLGGITKLGAVLAFTAAAFITATILNDVVRAIRARLRVTSENPLVSTWHLFNRHPRRYGGYLVHLAVVLIAVGIAGYGAYQQTETFAAVEPGDTMEISSYTLTFNGLEQTEENGVTIVYTDLVVAENGRQLGLLRPEKEFHPGYAETMGPTTEVAIMGGLRQDLYVILAGWTEYGATATFKIITNPLMAWIWIGLYLLVAGTLFAVWPRRTGNTV